MSDSTPRVKRWLETARWAASGGNAQPWLVEFHETPGEIAIKLSIDPQYIPKHSPLDVKGAAAALSLGCLTTNLIALAAQDEFGLSDTKIHSAEDYWKGSVVLTFKTSVPAHKTYTAGEIINRRTNRYPFQTREIPEELRHTIWNLPKKYRKLAISEYSKNKAEVIAELAPLERIRWHATSYFRSFLSEVSFHPDIQREPDKIPVSQLGIGKSDQASMRMLARHPSLHGFLRKIFFHHLVAKQALEGFRKNCDRIYFLQAPENGFEACFELGRVFQEIWLETERANVGFQPLGIPLLALGHWQGEPDLGLSASQIKDIELATTRIRERYAMDLRLPTIGFRVGYPTREAEKAPRKDLIGSPRDSIDSVHRNRAG